MIWIESCRDLTEEEIVRKTDEAFNMILEASKNFKESMNRILNNNTENNVVQDLLETFK